MSTLYRKYRPQAWSEVAAQDHVKTTLAYEVASGKTAHAYLFAGPRGVGKTTVARILARALNCVARAALQPGDPAKGDPCGECESCLATVEGRSLDVIEMDAASNRGIDAVRDNIVANARFTPARFAYKVFIIDEVHMLTTEAFNALLKTLEEPPAHAVFVLATTETHKVPATILSRCQRFDFRKIPFGEMVARLKDVAEREGVKVDARTLEEVARHGDGCLRDAESLLGKVFAMGDGKRVTHDEALLALPRTDAEAVTRMVDAILRKDARGALVALHEAVDDGMDAENLADAVIESLRTTLLAKAAGGADVAAFDLDETSKKRLGEWVALVSSEELVRAIELLLAKRREMRMAKPAHLPVELAIVTLCATVHAAQAATSTQGTPVLVAAAVKSVPEASKVAPGVQKGPEAVAAITETVTPVAQEVPIAAAVEASGVTFTLEKLAASWTEFMSRAGEVNAGMPFLLAAGRPVEIVGQIVRIGFEYSLHKDKLNQEKHRRILEGVLTAMFGGEARVEGVVLEKVPGLGDTGSVAADAGPVPVSAPAHAPAGAFDGNVMSAFGGRVVE